MEQTKAYAEQITEYTEDDARAALPTLAADANKYTRGMCELVVGSSEFPGAAVLSTLAANKLTAGYVTAYTCKAAARAIRSLQPSVVVRSPKEFAGRAHDPKPGKPGAVVAGCGMANGVDERELLAQVLDVAAPVLLDGGALSMLGEPRFSTQLRERRQRGLVTVLTPHAGEAARLLEAEAKRCLVLEDSLDETNSTWIWAHGRCDLFADADPKARPAEAAWLIALAYRAICVLKGPDTYIAAPYLDLSEGDPLQALVIREGGPALAKAGTGDVLAGTIGSLLAYGMKPEDACALGVFLHARAGRIAASDLGELCVTAEDVLERIPAAVKSL